MLLESHSLSSTFAGVHDLECNGLQTSGNAYPNGIPGNFEFSNGAALITLNETDAAAGGGHRSEMSFKPDGGMSPEGEMWYVWEFMIPESWGNDPAGFAIMQIHESPGTSVAVQLTLHYEAGQLVARVPVDVLTPGNTSYRVGSHAVNQGQWYSMCLRANWKLDATGSWELYVNGVPLMKRFNFANCYDRVEGGYLKLGIYNFNSTSGYSSKTIHIRNVKIWSGNDGYQTVMGGLPGSDVRRIGV